MKLSTSLNSASAQPTFTKLTLLRFSSAASFTFAEEKKGSICPPIFRQ
jgi:hypothetical protein